MTTNVTEYVNMSVSDIAQMSFEVILMVFICTVNSLTLIVVGLNKKLWTVPNMYIVSLTIADLLTGLSLAYQMVFHIPEIKSAFHHDKLLCLFRHVLLFVTLAASIVNMVLIAVDRWTCITFPFAYERLATLPKAAILIGIAWIFAILLGTVPLYYNHWEHEGLCLFGKVLTKEYQMYAQCGFFVVSSVIIAACYGHIFHTAKRERNAIMDLTVVANSLTHDKRKAKFRRDWELVVMFSVVFGVFFVCCFPAFLFVVITYTTGVPDTVNSFTIPVIVMNSGMNFIIYVVKNSHFRKALKATCFTSRRLAVGAT